MKHIVTGIAARSGPALVSIGRDGERLELTGAVFANWVHKSAGLCDELGVGPDLALGVVCPAPGALHWRALAVVVAAWSTGAVVHLLTEHSAPPAEPWVALRPEAPAGDAGDSGTDVTGTGEADPGLDHDAEEVLVFATGALALSARTPPGCIDFNAAVRSHPDVTALGSPDSGAVVGPEGASYAVDLRSVDPRQSERTDEAVALTGLPTGPDEWTRLLDALLHGMLVLGDIVDAEELARAAGDSAVFHDTIGAWTK